MEKQNFERIPKRLLAARLVALFTEVLRSPRNWPAAVWKIRNQLLPNIPLPVRLPWGDRWLAWNDIMGRHVWLNESFERSESAFFRRFITPGMVVVECGAHQGYFTLLLARQVGPHGQVIAIEPSPRERARLIRHLDLNTRRNVIVQSCALGAKPGVGTLYLCKQETGCNSLRPPAVSEKTEPICVQVATLDELLLSQHQRPVDVIKIDAEGAELGILQGAESTLHRARPIVFCELADIRTEPWGYPARAIYRFLEERDYCWFSIGTNGGLTACLPRASFHENLVAVPKTKVLGMWA